jgi:hypothetical protein
MGTGKSTWVTMTIKANPENRYIIVLPTLDELKRYEVDLSGIEYLVSLRNGTAKKERFDSALEHASVILITHSLYEKYLDADSFIQIRQGQWRLVMDEVVTAFETVEASHIDIRGLCDVGALKTKEISTGIELLQPDPEKFHYFRSARKETARSVHKAVLSASLVKDLYRFTCDSGNHYYTFSLQEQRLSAFEEVIILTYPFKDTDLEYWFRIKQLEVEHLELTRVRDTGSLGDFHLKPHSGEYSGKNFKHLIEFLETPPVRGKQKYGNRYNHFSATSMDTVFNPKRKDKKDLKARQSVINELRTLFRIKRKVDPEDFMFTCKADSMLAFRDSKNGLTKKFISDDTFVAYNMRATNDYDHKHYLAYLYNVFPFLPVEQMVKSNGLIYDAERYALYVLIQWIWRSAIRRGEKIYLYLPSRRMKDILEDWLNA